MAEHIADYVAPSDDGEGGGHGSSGRAAWNEAVEGIKPASVTQGAVECPLKRYGRCPVSDPLEAKFEAEYDKIMGLLQSIQIPCLNPGGRFGEDQCGRCNGCRLRDAKRAWKVARGG